MDKEKQEFKGGNYLLPSYDKLFSFPNFKTKLVKKLMIKKDTLITKHAVEKHSSEPNKTYLIYLNAEIDLIQWLLDNKEVKDVK